MNQDFLRIIHLNDNSNNFFFIPTIDYQIKDLGKYNYPAIEYVELPNDISPITNTNFENGSIIKLTIHKDLIYSNYKYSNYKFLIL